MIRAAPATGLALFLSCAPALAQDAMPPALGQGVLPPVAPDSPPAVDEAARDQARKAYWRGAGLYESGDYFHAIEEFKRAHGLFPKSEILYNIAQAERLTGRCAEALDYYRRFVAAHSGTLPEGTRERIHQMEACMDAEKAAVTRGERAPASPSSSVPMAKAQPERGDDGRFLIRAAGYACVGGAVATGAVAVLSAVQLRSTHGDLTSASADGEWSIERTKAEARYEDARAATIGFSVATGVLGLAGAWLLIAGHDPPVANDQKVSFDVRAGRELAVSGRFRF